MSSKRRKNSGGRTYVVREGYACLWSHRGERLGRPVRVKELSDGKVIFADYPAGTYAHSWREACIADDGVWLWDGDEGEVFGRSSFDGCAWLHNWT